LKPGEPCPCGSGSGSGKGYSACCGRLHSGAENAATAEALMRSRYSAYVLKLDDYLLATWHPDTRPSELDLAADGTKWLGLEVRRYEVQDDSHATVEFVARYRIAGKGHRLHELSRFVREGVRWFYIDGTINGSCAFP
jgi:SEC-C motif-containing protein